MPNNFIDQMALQNPYLKLPHELPHGLITPPGKGQRTGGQRKGQTPS